MLNQKIFYVGLRYQHHALHSGYEGYGRYLGDFLRPPVNFRWTLGPIGWPLTIFINVVTGHLWYSLGAFFTEVATLWHMLLHRKSVYHVLYGDSDLWLLPFFKGWTRTRNLLIASFHQPSPHLKELGAIERIAKNLDGVVLVSEAQRPYFEEILDRQRVFVVPHGIDTDFFCPSNNKADQPTCITVGSHLRDFKTLKEAMQLVWQVNPQVRFIAVGTRNNKKCFFDGLEDERIQFLEGLSDEDLKAAYQKAHLAVFSFQEATANNALLEAMASGLPVVATNTGGIPEYVDSETGVLCEQGSPEALAEGMLKVLSNPDYQAKLSKAARTKALRYNYASTAKQMSEVYRKVAQLHKVGSEVLLQG
ncbi:glycosyltransferase family 4 protein [Pseudanabaena sp. FACHB-2040]|uniref:glycosyltransferase family 4 protein n=1 Tax=Pseudanabaena sp. FACHB-2040 TaxID=2692859 RepID=UPI001684B03A|nr:glycosyltransferase family 4 protein [Pseudanabaena sp. FACHB-2040]MBD2256340.1 glycosyltransferase family 4 protein [Pseudanabaena sp. FACHB-2040]